MNSSNAVLVPFKTRTATGKLRINIEALYASHIVREHFGVTLCDINQLEALYNEIVTGNAETHARLNESEVFISNGMRPILEVSGFPLSVKCGQYFINWHAMR